MRLAQAAPLPKALDISLFYFVIPWLNCVSAILWRVEEAGYVPPAAAVIEIEGMREVFWVNRLLDEGGIR